MDYLEYLCNFNMEDSIISKKNLFLIVLISSVIITVLYLFALKNITTVVFCDVGQGDGIYIRTELGTDILIDAGPNNAILTCLGEHMPFYDHTIEYVILSHAHLDHYGGFEEIVQRYTIKSFFYSFLPDVDPSFNYLVKKLQNKKINLTALKNTDVLSFDAISHMKFIWPSPSFLNSYSQEKDDLNDTSLTGIFTTGNFDILLTGDISPDTIAQMLRSMSRNDISMIRNIEVLKVPHHGSANGLTPELLDKVNPFLSVATVGQKNKFNHPSQDIVELFKKTNRTFFTTAEQGAIVLKIYHGLWTMETSQK